LDPIVVFYIIDVLLALVLIFLERRRPENVLFWLAVLFFLPEIGFFIYLIFGRRPYRWNKIALRAEERDQEYLKHLSGMEGFDDSIPHTAGARGAMGEHRQTVSFLEVSGSSLTKENSVHIITEGVEKYDLLFEDIRKAKHHVHLEYFVFRNDDIGKELLSLLVSKADEGVRVRLLIDDVGGRPSEIALLELKSKGGEYARFYPSYVPFLRWLNVNINYRNHRKIAVVDGRIAYTGGFNIGDEYVGKDPKLGHWRDTHIRVEGPAVRSLQLRFLIDWDYASGEEMDDFAKYFPVAYNKGETTIQVVSSGPTERAEQVKEAYLKLTASAKKSIFIQTPYFVPDQSIMDTLRIASRSGVDVRIMVPRRKDQLLVHWVSQSFIGELLEAGVRAFYYDDGFLHSKTITVDGIVTSIGSANWDIRAFALNFETNAIILDGGVAREHERIFYKDMESCSELTKELYDRRGLAERIKESISRLVAPVL